MVDESAAQTKVSIRNLTAEHVSNIDSPWMRELADAGLLLMTQGGHAWCILVDGVPAGLGTVTATGELMLALLPAHQRRGIGTSLLPKLAQRVFATGATRVHARARINSGGAALALKVGFEQTGSSEDELFFELTAPK
jgi:GNAT superfamily N-acetyltransferase